MKQSRTMEEMRNKSLAPHPGLGPPQEARALGFVESYLVAEAESGDWGHVHFLGGDGFEVTAITCACAALVILEEFESLAVDARGVLTPAAAFHGSSFQQRLEAHAFAAGTGPKMSFEVVEGKPTEEQIVAALTAAASRRQKVGQLLESGRLQAWDVPAMIK